MTITNKTPYGLIRATGADSQMIPSETVLAMIQQLASDPSATTTGDAWKPGHLRSMRLVEVLDKAGNRTGEIVAAIKCAHCGGCDRGNAYDPDAETNASDGPGPNCGFNLAAAAIHAGQIPAVVAAGITAASIEWVVYAKAPETEY